jgi:hypothetical protein
MEISIPFRCITPQGFLCLCLCLSYFFFFGSRTDGRSPVRITNFHQIVPSVVVNPDEISNPLDIPQGFLCVCLCLLGSVRTDEVRPSV